MKISRFIGLLLCLSISELAFTQFIDSFDQGDLKEDPSAYAGWAFFSGDGNAEISLRQEQYKGLIEVDARKDTHNIWWAVIRRHVSGPDMDLLSQPGYELRVEARIKLSHAPRRVNLHFNTQRTTNFYSHLKEYDIGDTTHWHVISMTTQDFDALPGDTVYVQMALMDWGTDLYRVHIDYIRVDIVMIDSTGPDLGHPMDYHPATPPVSEFSRHISVTADAGINPYYPELNFNDWQVMQAVDTIHLLPVDQAQNVILRWDIKELQGKTVDGLGLLELSTFNLQGKAELLKDFGGIRVTEILGGDPAWEDESVTWASFCNKLPIDQVFNSQMIIDVEPEILKQEKVYITLSEPVLQRIVDGKTKGLAILPQGAISASFYSRENGISGRTTKLHFNTKQE